MFSLLEKYDRSFNSLQTGRTFRTEIKGWGFREVVKFQFPSNGKDFPNKQPKGCKDWEYFCFNSLQTGRTFRTNAPTSSRRHLKQCFNSLQTGRTFRTAPLAKPVTVRAKLPDSKRDEFQTFLNDPIIVKLPLNPHEH